MILAAPASHLHPAAVWASIACVLQPASFQPRTCGMRCSCTLWLACAAGFCKCSAHTLLPPQQLANGCAHVCRLGKHYPTQIHSRDASSYPFDNGLNSEPDQNTICGALVSGPDRDEGFADVRKNYNQTEPAIDFASGVLCAFGAYADQPDGAFDDCDVDRTPLTGQ